MLVQNMNETHDYVFRKFLIDNFLDRRMPIEIPNTNRVTLAKLFGELGFKVGAEIGVEQGLYSKVLFENNPGLELHLVDPWKAYEGYREHVSQEKLDEFVEITKTRLHTYNYKIVREFSVEAAKLFKDESLDFVYIDGNHDLMHAVEDICSWYPKVKKGGIVSGHDYISRRDPKMGMHVPEALKAFTSAYRISPLFILGRKDKLEGELRDSTRSWFFVKE